MPKFKVGDIITAIEHNHGFEEAIVSKIDKKYYYLSILNGVATIPISAESNYCKMKAKK